MSRPHLFSNMFFEVIWSTFHAFFSGFRDADGTNRTLWEAQGPLLGFLGDPCVDFGAFGQQLGRSGEPLRSPGTPFWELLRSSGALLGAFGRHLGDFGGVLGCLLGGFCVTLGQYLDMSLPGPALPALSV